jgi:hypothetical protein
VPAVTAAPLHVGTAVDLRPTISFYTAGAARRPGSRSASCRTAPAPMAPGRGGDVACRAPSPGGNDRTANSAPRGLGAQLENPLHRQVSDPRSMKHRAAGNVLHVARGPTALTQSLIGCAATWSAPLTPPLRGGDDRVCAGDIQCVDLVLVVDTSRSTGYAPDEDEGFPLYAGRLDANQGTTLWIELEGISRAVERMHRATHAVAIVGFAGWPGVGRAAWVEAEMTNDPAVIRAAVDRIGGRGALGASCLSCGVETGTSLVEKRSKSTGRCQVMVVVSDGTPTLPYGPGYEERNRSAVSAALRA